MISEQQLENWSRPLSDTEDAKCVNARKQITDALRAHFGQNIKIFTQGSYANNTNVRQDSDIDIVVVHKDYYFSSDVWLEEEEKQHYWNNFVVAEGYSFTQFRADVHKVLSDTFPNIVESKNKCLNVEGNTTRMTADVVPSFEHRRMRTPTEVAHTGISFHPVNGNRIDSFPDQHYENGVTKNNQTAHGYKQVVRILKNIKINLSEDGVAEAEPMSSFFIESLVYNVPIKHFEGSSFLEVTRKVITKIWNDMRDPEVAKNYTEVSELFYLFIGKHTPAEAEAFMLKAWNYLK